MTNLPIHKVSEDATTITLGWTPVGDLGYRFARSAGGGKFSNTWDSTRNSARFSKDSEWYSVEALSAAAAGVYPDVTPPPPPSSVPRCGISIGGEPLGWSDADFNWLLDRCKEAGAKVVRADAYGVYGSLDRFVNGCKSRGMESLLILGGQMSQPMSDSAYRALCAAILSNYYPLGVRLYECPNEPNLFNWTGASYANATKIAYEEIKKAPGTLLAIGGLSLGTDSMWPFAQAMFAAGVGGHFDAFSWHPYNNSQEHGDWSAWDCMFGYSGNKWAGDNNIVGLMKAHGGVKPAWATECGDRMDKTGLAKQATIVYNALTDPRTQMSCVYTMWMPGQYGDLQYFGLRNVDRSARPAFGEFQRAAGA